MIVCMTIVLTALVIPRAAIVTLGFLLYMYIYANMHGGRAYVHVELDCRDLACMSAAILAERVRRDGTNEVGVDHGGLF